jgi:hypothetical protein
MELAGQDRGAKQFVELATTPDAKGYNGFFYLGTVTASPPATHKGDAPVPAPRSSASSARSEANRAYDAKDYSICAQLFLDSAAAAPPGRASGDLYNAACCQALAGDRENAIQTLQRAIDGGLSDVEHVKADADLATLHGHPRWTALVSAAEARAKAKDRDGAPRSKAP